MSSSSPLFIGLDSSTQALKAIVVDAKLNIVQETRVGFEEDLPQYKTKKGAIVAQDGSVLAPVLMYVEAMEKVFDQLKQDGLDFSRVKAISGAAAQHSIVLLNDTWGPTVKKLSPSESLKDQLANVFSYPFATNWQDYTTTSQCREMENDIAKSRGDQFKDLSPAEVMAQVTGSAAHERFSGPQLKKVYQKHKDVFDKTDRMCVLSAFLTTLLCADGTVKAVEESDAAGTNLYSMETRQWEDSLLASVAGGNSKDAEKVRHMVGDVERDPRKSAGAIGKYYQERFGFGPDCNVVYLTGDNPATLLSFALRPGDAIVSLGTSDTVLLATESYNPNPNYHIFPHPAGKSKEGKDHYMGMLCYKNGSLAREMVRDGVHGSTTKDWDGFNHLATSTSPPTLITKPGQTSNSKTAFGFYFRDKEIIPRNVQGLFRLDPEMKLHRYDLDITALDKTQWDDEDPRRILESQFLSFKSKINQLLPPHAPKLRRIYVTGGASANPVIKSLLSTIINADIYSGGSAQGCATGGAYKAAWSYACKQGDHADFAEFVEKSRDPNQDLGGLVASPEEKLVPVYDELMDSWRKAEDIVVEASAK